MAHEAILMISIRSCDGTEWCVGVKKSAWKGWSGVRTQYVHVRPCL